MSRWREVIEYEGNNSLYSSSYYYSLFKPLQNLPPFPLFGYEIEDQLDFVFFDDLVSRKPSSCSIITDEIHTTPPSYSHYYHHHPSLYPRSTRFLLHPAPSLLDDLSNRLSFLESRFDRVNLGDRKNYTLTAEIKGDPERKYKWVTEIKPGSDKNKKNNGVKKWVVEDEEDEEEEEDDDDEEAEVRKYKWSAEIEGSGGRVGSRKYTIEVHTQTGTEFSKKNEEDENKKKKKKKVVVVEKNKNKRNNTGTRIVEIEDPDHGALVLRQV